MPAQSRREMVLSQRSYQRLLKDLRELVARGKARAEEAASQVLLESYHAIGRRILNAKLSERAGYGSALLQRLARELEISERMLQEAVAFARLYPTLPGGKRRLRWTHYRELLKVKDRGARTFYEEQATQQAWTRSKLAEAIRSGQHRRMLGLGHATSPTMKATPIVLPRPGGAHRVYRAEVEQVVDGEILLVMIDLGFNLFTRQRVRLAQVDAPPLREAAGKKAQAFVQKALVSAEFVMLKAVALDQQGRTTVHVFYESDSRDENRIFSAGKHLNQELVASGLARAI